MDNKIQNGLNNPDYSESKLNYPARFNILFDYSPIALWEEDFSTLYYRLENLKSEGITDLKSKLLAEPELIEDLAKEIRILNVNKSTIDLFEAGSKKELLGSFGKLYSKTNSDLFIKELLAIWNKDEYFSTEYRSYSLKGNPIFTQLEYKIPQNAAEFSNVFVSIIDLTKLKSIENELLIKQEVYKTIFTFSPDGIIIEDKNGIILDANEAQHSSLGYKNGELVGKDIRSIASEENRSLVENNIIKILNGEMLFHELESLKKDGSRCINALRETRIPLPNGDYGLLNISTDVTEERKMQEALKKREEIFSSLFNYSSDMLIVCEPADSKIPIIVNINDTAISKYGYSRDEMLGQPITIFVSETELLKMINSKIMDGEVIRFETEHICKDGTTCPVEVNAKLITLFGKKNIFIVAHDISNIKNEENKRLQKIKFLEASTKISETILSEDKIYNLLSTVIDIIGETLALDRAFIYDINIINRVGEKLTVWNNPNTENMILAEENYPVDTFLESFKYAITKKDFFISHFDERHYTFVGKAGNVIHDQLQIKTILWMPFSFSPEKFLLLTLNQTEYKRNFTTAEKEFVYLVTQHLNLAIMKIGFLNKQLEQKLEMKKLSQSIEQSPTEIIITDAKGNFEYVNPKFTETTGYTLEEIKGMNPRILKSGYTTQEEYNDLWKTITSGETWVGEFRNKKKNGELYWESAIISPVKDESGKIKNYLAIKEVITEKKKLLKELKIANLKAEKISKLKSSFISQMSHEIRTPINTIISFSSLLKDDLEGTIRKDLEKSFDAIERGGRRIIRTTELLLSLSEIQTDTYEPNFKVIDINIEVLGTIALEFKNLAANKNIKFEYKIQAEDAVVTADGFSLEKIFRNLIENAIKYTVKGSVVLKVYKNKDNKIAVQISDTGIGISEDFIPHMYEAFSQEESGYSRSYDGNGIGLCLVNEYCKLNNIDISVESKKEVGTTFTLVF